MPKENNKIDINKHEVNIDTLFKQNVNDLSSIKELYSKLEELGEKITQIKYIDSKLADKLKKDYESLKKTISEDYESLKCVILDENIQAKLANDIETINSQMDTKANLNDIHYIRPEWFSSWNELDMTQAIQDAIDYSNSKANRPAIKLSCRAYKTTSPLIMRDVQLVGEFSPNDEYHKKARIENYTSDMFDMTSDLTGHVFYGIEFRGNNTTNFFAAQNTDSGYTHKWGTIEKCGFDGFKKVFPSVRLLGMQIRSLYINNGNGVGKIAGSDNMISDIFVACNSTVIDYLIEFTSFSLSRITNIFFTGSLVEGQGAMNIMKMSSCENNTFIGNWFDYCDRCAIYMAEGINKGNTFVGNFFRYNVRVPNAQYSEIITMFGASNNTFTGNQFSTQKSSPITFSFRKEGDALCKNNQIVYNNYVNGYELSVKKPNGEHENNFIAEPTQSLCKGKMFNGLDWVEPINRVSVQNITLYFTGQSYATLSSYDKKTISQNVGKIIPKNSNISIVGSNGVKNGISINLYGDGTTSLKIELINNTSNTITLEDITLDLFVIY